MKSAHLIDEASNFTSLSALITDEKAAVDAYTVAIDNFENKLTPKELAVLMNIRTDELKHIENLYAIVNGRVSEKNMHDSSKRNYRNGNHRYSNQ